MIVGVLNDSSENSIQNITEKHSRMSGSTLINLPDTVSENARSLVSSPNGGDDDLEMWDQSGFVLRGDGDDPPTNSKWGARGWCRPSCIQITFIFISIVNVVLLLLLVYAANKQQQHSTNSTDVGNDSGLTCTDSCGINLVESIPIGVVYSNDSVSHPSIYHSWMELIASAQTSIEIVSLSLQLRSEEIYSNYGADKGENVFEALLEAGRDRGVRLRFIENSAEGQFSRNDSEYLSKMANAETRALSFRGVSDDGIMHSKLWLIDRTHVYVGSANAAWHAMTQKNELGLVATNCSCLANDIAKIFDLYWKLSENGKVPAAWPESLATKMNVDNPMNLYSEGNKYRAFFASSPPALSPEGRTNDLDAILHCIDEAEKFIHISVTKYFPLTIYTPEMEYWPIIDDALRSAAIEHKVHVRLLISGKKHAKASTIPFLQSLAALTQSNNNVNIEVKFFDVPTNSEFFQTRHLRNHHSKYMVTDVAAYIGTSNWCGDYFISTSGIGVVFEDVGNKNNGSVRQQLEDTFHRDWNSEYAYSLNATLPTRDIL